MSTTEIEQIAEIQKDSKDFETLLDVFRTLLKWSDEICTCEQCEPGYAEYKREAECEGMPQLTSSGIVIVPFNSPAKYHYWNGGQSLAETAIELGTPLEVIEKYQSKVSSGQPKPVEVIDSKKEGGHE